MVFITVNAFILVDVEPESRPCAGILLAVSVGRAAQAEPTAAALCSGEWQLLQAELGRLSCCRLSMDGLMCRLFLGISLLPAFHVFGLWVMMFRLL